MALRRLAGAVVSAVVLVAAPVIGQMRPTGDGASTPRAKQKAHKAGEPTLKQVGEASWYGAPLAGKKTASGEAFDPTQMTAAHRTLPLGTKAVVTNLKTGKSTEVKINDRGPLCKGTQD